MADPFEKHSSQLDSPARRAIEVTPDDGNDLAISARCLYIGVSGHIKVQTVDGDVATFNNHPAGYMLVRVKKVFADVTTATGIVALI